MNPQPDNERSPGLVAERSATSDRLIVTVADVVTGKVLERTVIYDDYLLVCAGHPYLFNTQVHANGTHVLTVKNAGPWRAHHDARRRTVSS